MQEIPLINAPNQELFFMEKEQKFKIKLYATDYTMLGEIYINDKPVLTGFKLLPLTYFLSYPYLIPKGIGNFFIECKPEAEVDYNQFGITQSLVYVNEWELLIHG